MFEKADVIIVELQNLKLLSNKYEYSLIFFFNFALYVQFISDL